eukprot:TRINITY_DN2012_c0_g1_i1.p1 TRINITY_DN2012_c0_g1~~TRINITY_DN2012_c0_g1_i1.p1  ORF type:complete len:254 (-),score=98.34 TRINITY_DN2012_c0_g1_i1:510-1271(-)
MANLDDFFNKKDKKKKKTSRTTGFSKANTDVIVKNLEVQRTRDQEKESEQAEPLATTVVNQSSQESAAQHPNGQKVAEDEWYDYNPEEKDYTGLKIEALNIQEDNLTAEDDNSEGAHDVHEENRKKDGGSSVWSASGKPNGNEAASEPSALSMTHSIPEPTPAASSAYIPPEKMRAMNSVLGGGPKPRKSKAAPDIHSQIYFPSLSASLVPCEDDSRRHKFEEVRGGGGSASHLHRSEAPRIALDNKFSALRE